MVGSQHSPIARVNGRVVAITLAMVYTISDPFSPIPGVPAATPPGRAVYQLLDIEKSRGAHPVAIFE
jgi:hypothetical protein